MEQVRKSGQVSQAAPGLFGSCSESQTDPSRAATVNEPSLGQPGDMGTPHHTLSSLLPPIDLAAPTQREPGGLSLPLGCIRYVGLFPQALWPGPAPGPTPAAVVSNKVNAQREGGRREGGQGR